MNWQEKNVLSCIGQCFRLILDTTLEKPENMLKKCVSKLPITENRITEFLLVCFLLPLLFRQMVEKLLVLFGSHCKIFELKFSIRTKFDTLVSNLNSYVQYKIVMTSL